VRNKNKLPTKERRTKLKFNLKAIKKNKLLRKRRKIKSKSNKKKVRKKKKFPIKERRTKSKTHNEFIIDDVLSFSISTQADC
jgi:hypothetical protein